MSSKMLFVAPSLVWPTLLLISFIVRMAVLGSHPTTVEYGCWLFFACAPGVIAAMVARGMPARSIAAVIYDTEHSGDRDGR